MIKCFWENLEFFFRYQQMVLRLIWRAGLSPDFAKVMAVEGHTRRSEARCLYELAQESSEQGVIVEIGSYRGLSTVALARGSLQGPRIPIYSIDPHEAGPRSPYGPQDNVPFFRNLLISGVAEMVRPIALLSSEAVRGWNKPVSLLWIDGNHQYEVVKRDFIEWSGFLIEGGYLAFHDSLDPGGGPYQVVQEALQEGTFELVKRAEKVSVLKKRKSWGKIASGFCLPIG
jgi:hypothetical protein